MGDYLVERFLASADAPGRGGDAADAAFAVPGVRGLQTIYVPDDEICLYLLESESIELVERASQAAGLTVDRIHAVQRSGCGC